ncbi:hypothetical protein JYT26_00215 [Beggiatoa alba]|nr:hypothetical protein [Beggiatoa alba]
MPIQEILQQLITYLRGIWRYRWFAIALAWVIAVGGWVFVAKMPDQYQANARVYVDTTSLLRPLLRGLATQSNVGQRLQLMSKTLLSRPNMEKIVRMTDLDITVKTPGQMESLLDGLSRNIKFGNTKRANLYTISYANKDAEVAKRVVQSLLTIFVESTLGETREDSHSAQKFLVQQIKEHEMRLTQAEDRIKEFKRRNVNQMPQTGRGFFTRLQGVQDQLAEARLLLNEAVDRRDELRRQIRGEEPVFGFGTSSISLQPSHPLDVRIQKLQSRIDELLLQYTNQHPEVISAKNTIIFLEKQREDEVSALPATSSSTISPLEKNPVYQQLKIALGQAKANVASLTVRVNEYQGRVSNLKKMVDTIPEIEAEFKGLNRDYDLTKKNYNALVARLESAKMGEQMEQTGDNVKFKVIDPPRVPLSPSGPNRVLLSSAIFLLAIGAGIALAFLLSQIRPTVYDQQTLRKISGLPVFGSVSRIWTPELLTKRRLQLGAFIGVGAVLLVVYSGVVFLFGSDGQMLKIVGQWL